jgi:REP element-mobilizing transposase RayT
MPSTYTSLHYHLIFSTKCRQPCIEKSWRDDLHRYLHGTAEGLGGYPRIAGGIHDHVHLLVSLKPTACLSDFVRELKKASSSWVGQTHLPGFSWQNGYAALTVSPSARNEVMRYIARQEEHHRVRTFRDELVDFLERAGVDYDERYLD